MDIRDQSPRFYHPKQCPGLLVVRRSGNSRSRAIKRHNHLESNNTFLSHQVDITALLKPRESNILSIEFDSAFLCGRALQKKHPEVRLETSVRTQATSALITSDDLSTITGKIAPGIESLVDKVIYAIGSENEHIFRVSQ